VNVRYEVYRIKTNMTESGGKVEKGQGVSLHQREISFDEHGFAIGIVSKVEVKVLLYGKGLLFRTRNFSF
jgi:hypothetical protein